MELTVLEDCIYEIERPINVDKIEYDLRNLAHLIAPGKLSLKQYERFVQELDSYRIRYDTEDDLCNEVIMCLYKSTKSVPTAQDISEHIMSYNFMLESYIADAILCIKLELGEITSEYYVNEYESLMEEINEEFAYDFYYYGYSIEHMITKCVQNNLLLLDTEYFSEYFYCEGIDVDESFFSALSEFEKIGDISINDCQQILIDDLVEYGCIQIDPKTINIDLDRVSNKEKVKMIGGK